MSSTATMALDAALLLAAAPFAACSAYVAALAACSRRPGAPAPVEPRARFEIVVPAHDEEAVIASTLSSIAALRYPAERVRVTVVADNCTDRTAEVARLAGVRVLERRDPGRRGKGHALSFAFADVMRSSTADAVVVVDADTIVSPGLLRIFAERLAAGESVVQARYGVRDESASWRGRLMSLAFVLFHDVRSLGRERLGLSCGLRGNGMCFTRGVLERVPYAAHSLVEDLEYGIELGLAGVRVAYAHHALVRGDMPAGSRASRTQRDRWEQGRAAIARRYRGPLLRAGMRRGGRVPLDLAADLLVPPLTTLGVASALGTLVAVAGWLAGWTGVVPALVWAGALLGLLVYVARGCVLADGGARVLGDLAWAPVYVVWKLLPDGRAMKRGPVTEWIRTSRGAER